MTNRAPQMNDDDLELLSAYLDRQLPDTARAALELRLGREPQLRRTLDELQVTVAALRALEPVRPPRSFTIDPRSVGVRGPASQSGSWWLRLVLPFGGLAALLVAFVFFSQLGGGAASPAAQVAAAPTAAPAAEQAVPEAPRMMSAASAPTAAPAATEAPAPTTGPAELAIQAPAAPAAPVNPDAASGAAADTTVQSPAPALPQAEAPATDPAAGASTAKTSDRAALTATDPVADLTTPASSSPGTVTLAPAAPGTTTTAPSALFLVPFVLTISLLVVAGVAWLRRRR